MKIAIVAGGNSSECGVSLKSAKGIMEFIPDKYEKYIVTVIGKNWNVQTSDNEQSTVDKNDFSFILNGEKAYFDFAYITIHGTPGENGILQGYFDLIGMPYSCCGVLAAALTFDKFVCSNFLKNFDINISKSILLRENKNIDSELIIKDFGLPLFVKPSNGGSSFGITKVKEINQLQPAVDKAFAESCEVMIESFISGVEVTCGMYKTKEKSVIFPVFELEYDADFFDYDAKYNGKSREFPAKSISVEIQKEIQQTTAKIYDLINAKGIIRVDYIVEKNGKIVLLEVNTTPGMTPQSFIPQQIRAAGLNIAGVMQEIIENSII
ncbi:MAG: D-alanine--D-alanine ligase [Prevotellaceae bacterium]|jgi:D-alanine-D-alanine ligase|nr:D-alanine--D-alanine ligase [Prevotellaceae bacterium]